MDTFKPDQSYLFLPMNLGRTQGFPLPQGATTDAYQTLMTLIRCSVELNFGQSKCEAKTSLPPRKDFSAILYFSFVVKIQPSFCKSAVTEASTLVF